MDVSYIQHLLIHVSEINKKYEKIAEISGENFNIFEILDLTESEVRLHSALIGELLSPKGSHGQKDLFLRLFIDQIKIESISDNEFKINTSNTRVEIEKFIGPVTKTHGGRIDLFIIEGGNAIIIENKIYARDQEYQLLRYFNYAKDKDLKFRILYLNLYGRPPVKSSSDILIQDNDFLIISYKEHIIPWLEKCRKEATGHPLVRETLTQYINQLKYLTGQAMKDDEKAEIVSTIIKNPNYMAAIMELTENNIWYETRRTILSELGKQLLGENGIGVQLGFNQKYYEGKGFGLNEFDFWFWKDNWKYCIFFCFENDFETISYGIYVIDVRIDKPTIDDIQKFKDCLGESVVTGNWVWKSNFKEYSDMSWSKRKDEGRELFLNTIMKITGQVGDLILK